MVGLWPGFPTLHMGVRGRKAWICWTTARSLWAELLWPSLGRSMRRHGDSGGFLWSVFCIAIFGEFHQKFGSHVRGISPRFGVPLEVAGDTAAAFPFFRVLFDRISLSRNVYMCIPVYPRVASFINRETSFEPSYLEFWGCAIFLTLPGHSSTEGGGWLVMPRQRRCVSLL